MNMNYQQQYEELEQKYEQLYNAIVAARKVQKVQEENRRCFRKCTQDLEQERAKVNSLDKLIAREKTARAGAQANLF
jgi:hypothetical protein